MGNLLAIVVESIRRLGALRHLVAALPPFVQLLAAATTLVLVAVVPIVTFFGDFILGSGDGQESSATEDVGGATEDPLVVLASNQYWMAQPGYIDLDYDSEEFRGEPSAASEKFRPVGIVGISERDIFWTEFTVANTSQRERAIITAVSLQVEDFQPPPDRLRVGCPTGLGGGMEQEKIRFEMQLNSESIGVEQRVPTVPEPGTVLELGPDNLQAFDAFLTFSAPGVHRYSMVVHYDTSGGRSATAVSEPLEVLLMPSAQGVEGVVLGECPTCECPRGEADEVRPCVSLTAQCEAQVTNVGPDRLNLREGPNTTTDVIGELPEGEIVCLTGSSLLGDGFQWWPVRSQGGLEGWLAQGDPQAPERPWLTPTGRKCED